VAIEGITRLLLRDGIMSVHISQLTAAGEKVASSRLVSYEQLCACRLAGDHATLPVNYLHSE